MNTTVSNKNFDEERALYESHRLEVINCKFDGPADGESALKESSEIIVKDSYFNLRYPFWHNTGLTVTDSELTENCRAALWYSKDVLFENTKLHGIKAARESENIKFVNCSIKSPEFGWKNKAVYMSECETESEYFLLDSSDIILNKVKLNGKYSFQYVINGSIEDCEFTTKDAFWHAQNITIKNCKIDGEYIGWYSKNLTFENCEISGTQPFCYCENLKLINCKLDKCDFAFEKSSVDAVLTAPVISIKNPYKGKIVLPGVQEIIITDKMAKGKIVCQKN